MWYLAEIITAEKPKKGRRVFVCESSNVLIEETSAYKAYAEAMRWGLQYTSGPSCPMRLLGVAHLTTLAPTIGPGTDIVGDIYRRRDVWRRRRSLIPRIKGLAAIRWEDRRHTPLRRLLRPEQVKNLRRIMRRIIG